MMMPPYYPNRPPIFLFAFLVVINLIALLPSPALADLPPRPGSPPSSSEAGPGSDAGNPIGGYIALRVPTAPPGIWTVVQWQDQAGTWHNTEGWQGTLDDGQQKLWWIDPADFGKGPFRWAVYQGQNGKLLADSAAFNLPGTAYETVSAEIEALPDPSFPQPDESAISQPSPAETPVAAPPDFMPVTGVKIETGNGGKLALAGGILLLLLGRAIIAVFKEKWS